MHDRQRTIDTLAFLSRLVGEPGPASSPDPRGWRVWLNEIAALQDLDARLREGARFVGAYRSFALGWFNLAVDLCDAARIEEASAAAMRATALDPSMREHLPERLRKAFIRVPDEATLVVAPEASTTKQRTAGRYTFLQELERNDSEVLLDAVANDTREPRTLRWIADMSPAAARSLYRDQVTTDDDLPGCIGMIEFFTDVTGEVYQVLPRLRGRTMVQLAGSLDARAAVQWVIIVARHLQILHSKGLVHGDLRPEHVFLDASKLEESVMFLGVSRLRTEVKRTLPLAHGRLAWLTPEEGGPTVEVRADVYGLALLLLYLITGKPPPSLLDRLAGRFPLLEGRGLLDRLGAIIGRAVDTEPQRRFGSARELADALEAVLAEPAAQLATSTVGGRWRLGKVLGEGAFGVVYEAQSIADPSLRAAIKVLHPHVALLGQARLRFLTEMRAVSELRHPNIVKYLDGSADTDDCFLAMEYIEGKTLRACIAEGALPVSEVRELGLQIASALSAAHQNGYVHRDLKPDNVIIHNDRDQSVAKVVDFGVARLVGDVPFGGAPLTTTGTLIGTPQYMAPEQWMTLKDQDQRCDTYALGLILYECLSGRLPFSATTLYEWQQAHLNAAVDVDDLPAPPKLRALIKRMLAKSRDDRPSTMMEVESELRAVELEAPPQQQSSRPSPSPQPRPESWAPPEQPLRSRRRRAPVVIAMAGAALIFGGGLLTAKYFLTPASVHRQPNHEISDAPATSRDESQITLVQVDAPATSRDGSQPTPTQADASATVIVEGAIIDHAEPASRSLPVLLQHVVQRTDAMRKDTSNALVDQLIQHGGSFAHAPTQAREFVPAYRETIGEIGEILARLVAIKDDATRTLADRILATYCLIYAAVEADLLADDLPGGYGYLDDWLILQSTVHIVDGRTLDKQEQLRVGVIASGLPPNVAQIVTIAVVQQEQRAQLLKSMPGPDLQHLFQQMPSEVPTEWVKNTATGNRPTGTSARGDWTVNSSGSIYSQGGSTYMRFNDGSSVYMSSSGKLLLPR